MAPNKARRTWCEKGEHRKTMWLRCSFYSNKYKIGWSNFIFIRFERFRLSVSAIICVYVYFYVSKHTNYLIWTGKWNWELGFEVHYLPSSASNHRCSMYSVVQKNPCMFEFPASLPPTNLGLPLHIRSAVMEHVSLNLARFFTRPCRIAIKRSNIVCLWRIKTSMGNWKNSPHHRLTGEFTG